MPLTDFQKEIVILLSKNRTPDSYLAGGAALHFSPDLTRYSKDLDYFHDSVKRLQEVFLNDLSILESGGVSIEVIRDFESFKSVRIFRDKNVAKVEWAKDSAFRFMPVEFDPICGYIMHPVDLATNKILAFLGRDEARDYYDLLHIIKEILPLGALAWAACGKDPGFNPSFILEMMKRKGRYRLEDFEDVILAQSIDLQKMKTEYLSAIEDAEAFIESRPMKEHGCLYYSHDKKCFVQPEPGEANIACHFGRPGGIIPQIVAE